MSRQRRMGTAGRFVHSRAGQPIWMSGIGEVQGITPEEFADYSLAPEHVMFNYLADEGEQLILDATFRAASFTTNFFLALATADPGETGTLATMSEVSGTGYGRITTARNTTDYPTLALNSGDYQVTGASKVFTAGGTWSAATHLILCTVTSGTSGKLLAVNALSATRTLLNTDTLTVTLSVKLQ